MDNPDKREQLAYAGRTKVGTVAFSVYRENEMSFEGYNEFRCGNGHTDAADVYEKQPTACRECGERWVKKRMIDCTNADARLVIAMLPIALIAGCAVAAANYWLSWFPDMKW